ncbi:hypothetical protein B0H63DRAFT_86948 [Podospora didyma]|uniref:TLC domain-containing protein n=1 Tax=Podospora didyma TaxID=330526 RepID=A0AAE0K1D4_9PEZI|nr:hypothetical protein B0H63DRAFT_86948 [Podospora didyma]
MIPAVAALLGDRENDRDVAIAFMLLMLGGKYLAALVLPKFWPRFAEHPEHRQQQLYAAVPINIMRLTVAFIIAESEFGGMGNFHKGNKKTVEELDYQFHAFCFLTLGYVFELLVLSLPPRMVAHHLAVISATYLYSYWRHTDDGSNHQARVDLYQVPAFMATYGTGAFDAAMDGVRLVYYGSPRSKKATSTRWLMKALNSLAWTSVSVQWMHTSSFVLSRFGALSGSLGPLEKVLCPAALMYWTFIEYDEIKKVDGIARKFDDQCVKAVGEEFQMKTVTM